MQIFSSVTVIEASRDAVWRVLTDHVRYAEWVAASRVTMERFGDDDPDGPGAVRVFHAGPVRTKEEVTDWVPHEMMAYRLVSGIPVRNYRARTVLRDGADGGTVMEWSSTFETKIPFTGRFFRWFLGRAVHDIADGIKASAEAEAEA
ncbi:MAG: SRPBCC family protein [Acidimicrobiia bacterium]|nr:SRPBCC family protein [Acidimicrobiia bacterium]